MKMNYRLAVGILAISSSFMVAACKPRTTGEKIRDKAEDATHEAGQGIERAGERVKDSAN